MDARDVITKNMTVSSLKKKMPIHWKVASVAGGALLARQLLRRKRHKQLLRRKAKGKLKQKETMAIL